MVPVVVEEDEIIHVAKVVFYAECFFYPVIKRIKVDIGQELTGQVADGKASCSVSALADYLPTEIQKEGVFYFSVDCFCQDGMIYGVKILSYIHF